jgi:hypothetical protein
VARFPCFVAHDEITRPAINLRSVHCSPQSLAGMLRFEI